MRGHIIAEDRFLHQGIEHHLFVTQVDGAEYEYRFEVKKFTPGVDHPETIYEKTEDLSSRFSIHAELELGELLCNELGAIKKEIFEEEDLHTHDP